MIPVLHHLKIYLVGGAVRDRLLGYPVHENDWVVVGATPEQLLALGFKPVGKDFPVFLHPETHEEYALARTERKTAPGYTGFVFHTAPEVTLEEDLQRRDLTINAMALTPEGEIIDPYGGQKDLRAKIVRHVSAAFIEDPVRILRVARFMARLAPLGFRIAPETAQLMQQMVRNNEVDALVPERVWQEYQRALCEADPLAFFHVLQQCGALPILFPEYAAHWAELTPPKVEDPCLRFAHFALPLTRQELWALTDRYPVSYTHRQIAIQAITLQNYFRATQLEAEQMMEIFDYSDTWRQPANLIVLLELFATAPLRRKIKTAYAKAAAITAAPFLAQGLSGKALGEAIRQARLGVVAQVVGR